MTSNYLLYNNVYNCAMLNENKCKQILWYACGDYCSSSSKCKNLTSETLDIKEDDQLNIVGDGQYIGTVSYLEGAEKNRDMFI